MEDRVTNASAIAWLAGFGVVLAGLYDWLQGSAPAGIVEVPDAFGLAVFLAAALGTILLAVLVGQRERPGRLRLAGVALASIAALFGDPTYAVLLLAVPLIDIARREIPPARARIIGAIVALAVALVAREGQSLTGPNLESTLVLFIALLITTALGFALGELDTARRVEIERARVDERQHLARELHDSVGHSLLATSIQLKNADALWERSPDAARRSLELASHAVGEALTDTRFAVDTIRAEGSPFSLLEALGQLVDRMASPTLDVELEVHGPVDDLDQLGQLSLYRVAQEALTNVVRHAGATRARVTHTVSATDAQLRVVDDGRGFDTSLGLGEAGLRSLAERLARVGGSLSVESTSAGTTVLATVGLDR